MLFAAHLVGLALTAIISAVVAWWIRRQTRDRAGKVMVAILLAHVAMATLVSAQLLAPTLAWKSLFATLWYLLILVIPVAWLLRPWDRGTTTVSRSVVRSYEPRAVLRRDAGRK